MLWRNSTWVFVAAAGLASAGLGCSEDEETGVPDGSGGELGGAGGDGATGGSGGYGGHGTSDLVGEVRRYDYGFDIETGAASSRLTIEALQGGHCFAVPCALEVSHVKHNGAEPTELAHDDGLLRVCGERVDAGATFTISSEQLVPEETFLDLDVGFSRRYDLAGGKLAYLQSWFDQCAHFGPCDDRSGKLVQLGFDVTHLPGNVVLCPGTVTPGTTSTRCELSTSLAPTYSGFAIMADPKWVRAPFVSAAGVDVVFYEVPGGNLAGSLDPGYVAAFLDWLTALLGPYPYGSELRVAGALMRWRGFEHPGNIALQQDLDTKVGYYLNAVAGTFMHELVHMWAGNHTTPAATADFAWKEALANYLPYLYADEQGPPEQVEASRAYWDDVSLQATHYLRPTEQPTPSIETFYRSAYGQGPMVLFIQLESMIGRPAVRAAIQSFLAPATARSVADLRDALEAASGESLEPYFDRWVFGSGKPEWPTFSVTTDQVGDQVTVTVTQQTTKPFPCVVEVDVSGASSTATATVDFGLAPTGASAQATITLAEPVVDFDLDPRHKVISKLAGAAPPPKLPLWID